MSNAELVESVAKRIHDLMKHPNEWEADRRTIGGTVWTTHYGESARAKYREHARSMIALVTGSPNQRDPGDWTY